jgi:ferritin-like metal-binding protein YciE
MGWFSNLQFDSLEDLFVAQLKDLYDAELRMVDALPKMIEGAHSESLKQALSLHLGETRSQVQRLENIFRFVEMEPEREACEAMKGLIAEGDEVLSASGDDAVRDAAIIAAAQRVEHYEMAGYGTLRTWAEHLGWADIARMLQTTLDEEGNADKILTEVAEQSVNLRAEMT